MRRNAGTLWHPVGTCAMGSGPAAVVDARLRVHGVAGLRVATRRSCPNPRSVSGKIQRRVIMIGEQAARLSHQPWWPARWK